MAIVGELVAARVAKHVTTCLDAQIGRDRRPPYPPVGYTVKRTIEKGDFQKASFLLPMKTAVTSPWRVGSRQVPSPCNTRRWGVFMLLSGVQ